jgi:hypothetical protein
MLNDEQKRTLTEQQERWVATLAAVVDVRQGATGDQHEVAETRAFIRRAATLYGPELVLRELGEIARDEALTEAEAAAWSACFERWIAGARDEDQVPRSLARDAYVAMDQLAPRLVLAPRVA